METTNSMPSPKIRKEARILFSSLFFNRVLEVPDSEIRKENTEISKANRPEKYKENCSD